MVQFAQFAQDMGNHSAAKLDAVARLEFIKFELEHLAPDPEQRLILIREFQELKVKASLPPPQPPTFNGSEQGETPAPRAPRRRSGTPGTPAAATPAAASAASRDGGHQASEEDFAQGGEFENLAKRMASALDSEEEEGECEGDGDAAKRARASE